MEADNRHLRCAAPSPFTKALARAFAFALARYRAVPIVSPSAPRKTPFADVRDDEMRTCWRRTSRRGSRTTSETASRLVSRGAAPGLAFLPPFPPLRTPRPCSPPTCTHLIRAGTLRLPHRGEETLSLRDFSRPKMGQLAMKRLTLSPRAPRQQFTQKTLPSSPPVPLGSCALDARCTLIVWTGSGPYA